MANARVVKELAKKFGIGQWSFLGPGSEKKWSSMEEISPQGIWDHVTEKMRETIETMFRIVVFANQLSLYGAVANICEEGQIDISGETKTARVLRGWHTTRHTIHSEIGARSVLQVVDEVLRTDELW